MNSRISNKNKSERAFKSLSKKNPPPELYETNPTLYEINQCRDISRPWIDLSNKKLKEVPEELYSLQHLEYIDFSDNFLTIIPEKLWTLPKLKRINAENNPLESLPNLPGLSVDVKTFLKFHNTEVDSKIELQIESDITSEEVDSLLPILKQPTGPKTLRIGKRRIVITRTRDQLSDQVGKILNSISSFLQLESLSIRGIVLGGVPEGIRQLHNLTQLSLNAVGLKALPVWISELPLISLSAFDNELTTLPKSFDRFRRLSNIDFSFNKFKKIPAPVFKTPSLTRIDLYKCNIEEIPADLLQLEALVELNIHSNPVSIPPEEISSKGLDAILNYWRQGVSTGMDYLCEGKLIILGEPGAGKTSLAKKLENKNYKLRPSEKSTEGIDVIRYHFPTTIKARGNGQTKTLRRQFQVNIWDFGGQEIYHATHQFFLTRRSVYILVCDDRKEDTDFAYWLNIVEMLSDSSPLLIVQNEKQDRTRDINLGSLQARFLNLKTSLPTNLDTNRGLDEIIQAVQKQLSQLPHVGTGLPATWKRVRNALEKEEREHISLDEYLNICQQNGFVNFEDKMQLSGYLHDLGICLHFQDDPVLKSTVILNPTWGTDAVYRVLDDTEVISAHGRFSDKQLKRIWNEKKYRGMQHELLRLMTKFQLCYELEIGGIYIAPQLLSSAQPSYTWDATDNLSVRYEYKFLPKGILTRLIVALHHLIVRELAWKSGVIFQCNGSRAEVIEEYSQRWITVRVNGPNRQGLLAIVDDQLRRLHATFHRLQYDLLVPCPCCECIEKQIPYVFSEERLTKMARKGSLIQCHESGEMVDAEKLLRGVLPWVMSLPATNEEFEKESTVKEENVVGKNILEVYVSYSWVADSSDLVDKLEENLTSRGIRLLRDKNEIGYKDSIKDFMERLGQGKAIVVVITDEYLKSEKCMFELLKISQSPNFRQRIFPIVLPSAKVYKPLDRVQYIKYWEDETEKLDDALKTLRGDNLVGLQDSLNLYSEIRRLFDQLTKILADMNALTVQMHVDKGFEQLTSRVVTELGIN